MTKEMLLLKELKSVVLGVEGLVVEQEIDDPGMFIEHYYQQEEVLAEIKGKLFDYCPARNANKSQWGGLVERLKVIMEEREQALLAFYDWGNPVALFMEKATTLTTLKTELMSVPTESL